MLTGGGSQQPPILPGFKGTSRDHADSDLRSYLAWCAGRGLDPFLARRPHLELYIRWMQEVRRFKLPAVSRRLSVVAGFYRTCVIDGVLEHSPAEHVRRPAVPAESPTLGFTHLQFEALLTAARESANRNDFALVAMLGLLGLRIFEATSADPVAGATANIHRSFPAQAASATTWMSRPGRAAARPQIVCRASTSRDAGAGVMSWCTRRAVSSGSIGAHIL